MTQFVVSWVIKALCVTRERVGGGGGKNKWVMREK